jgi:arylsulfatase A-like enzyme/lipopolysaccharide biosynthesis regulator YciM
VLASLIVLALLVAGSFYFLHFTKTGVLKTKKDYNLVLISIDTVRDDALGLYNPQGAPTPSLNRIAANGYVFVDVIAQVPFTLPSHTTMLTGTYPMKHLVQENINGLVGDKALTLAEVLKQNGYQTAGFIGSIVLASTVGINQGFDTYDDVFTLSDIKFADLGGVQKTADEVYQSFQTWFGKKPPGKFFAFVHFYDAHIPYEPPAAFTPEKITRDSMYKGELQYVDSVIGKLYDALAQEGVWENTVLVITGDHGEMLGEHGELGHGYFVYQEALKVPLIIVLPERVTKTVIPGPAQIVDVMPTILELLGIEIPREVQGRSLAPLMKGESPSSRIAYSESLSGTTTFGTAPLRSVQDATYKYIDSARPELYEIRMDASEQKNLYEQKKELAARMKTKLDDFLKRYSADPEEEAEERKLSAEEAEQLAALGYISGGSTAPEVSLSKDSKDYIEYWTDLSKLNAFLKDGNYEECLALTGKLRAADAFPVTAQIFEARAYIGVKQYPKAIEMLEEILKKDKEDSQAINTLAEAYEKAGNLEKAASIYKQLVESQDSILALQNYARRMNQLGKKEEALSYMEQTIQAGKFSEKHDEAIGETYVGLKEYDQARPYLMKAIERNPQAYKAYTLLANVLDSKGDKTAALTLLEGVKDRFEQPDFLTELGILYHKTGDLQKEFETFRRMIRLHPKDARGYFYVAKIMLDRGGDFNAVLKLAEKGLELKPNPEYQIFGNYLMADAYTNLGMPEKAGPFYAKAEKISAATREGNATKQ